MPPFSTAATAASRQIDVTRSLRAVAVGDYRIELSWTDVNDDESSYEIWRLDERNRGWRRIGDADRNATGYVDERVGPGEAYTYKIRARSALLDAVSRFSNEAGASTVFVNAPSGLAQTNRGAGAPFVNLRWIDNSANESRFVIERKNSPAGQWTQCATTAANVTEAAYLPAPASSAWLFRVGAHSSEYSSISYGEPILADNGYTVTVRTSPYGDGHGDGSGDSTIFGDGSIGGETYDESAASPPKSTELSAVSGNEPSVLKELKNLKIVDVSGGSIVGGDEPVSRGEFVAMLVRALRIDEKPLGSFDDVKRGHKYYGEIMAADRFGMITHAPSNMFYPDRIIMRSEIAEFIRDCSIAAGNPLPEHNAEALRPFPDAAEVPGRYLQLAQSVFGEKIMIGIGMPGNVKIIGITRESTRGQAALVVYRFWLWM